MLSLNNIKATNGSRKSSKRVGRGNASKGSFSGRGMNGQNARSGGGVAPRFEGGQTPLFRRMPKLKGFSNAKFKKEYNIITFRDLELLASKGITDINTETLRTNKMLQNKDAGIKLLSKSDLKSKFNIVIDKASTGAIEAVRKVGGKITLSEMTEKTEEIKIEEPKEEITKVKKEDKEQVEKTKVKEKASKKEETIEKDSSEEAQE